MTTCTFVQENSGKTMGIYFAHNGKVYRLTVPDDEDVWRAIDRYDQDNEEDFFDHLDDRDILGVNLAEYPDAEPVKSWNDVEAPEKVEATMRITSTGNSLILKVTKEARMLGLDRGDLVEVTLRRIRN